MFFGSYLSATAKCVGLTITTSAVGTLCIMRRRASCCCIWRMRCLVSGRPSDLLGLVAQLLARHAQRALELEQLQRHIDDGDQRERSAQPDERPSSTGPRRGRSPRAAPCAPSASTSREHASSRCRRTRRRPPRHLSSALPSSEAPCSPNRRFKPASGLMREKSGSQRRRAEIPAAEHHRREQHEADQGAEHRQHGRSARSMAASPSEDIIDCGSLQASADRWPGRWRIICDMPRGQRRRRSRPARRCRRSWSRSW